MRIKKKIILFLEIFLLSWICIYPISINYIQGGAPGANYSVKINKLTKTIHTKEEHGDSTVGGKGSYSENNIKLTDDEYKKVIKILIFKGAIFPFTQSREYLAEALCDISKGDEMFAEIENGKNGYLSEDDINNDGKVTHREFGDTWLDAILEE